MNDYLNNVIIAGVFSSISHLLILIGVIIIISKQKNAGSLLMFFGQILILLVSITNIIWPILFKTGSEKVIQIQSIISILSGISYFIFALGLLLFSIRLIKKERK